MQILSGLRYLHHPFSYPQHHYGSSTSSASGDDGISSTGSSAHTSSSVNNNIIIAMNKKLSIIHYDLKPANILFDEFGDVKITGKEPFLSCSLTLLILLF
jgi:serine/threonine protein kinase